LPFLSKSVLEKGGSSARVFKKNMVGWRPHKLTADLPQKGGEARNSRLKAGKSKAGNLPRKQKKKELENKQEWPIRKTKRDNQPKDGGRLGSLIGERGKGGIPSGVESRRVG